jgi:hypothetical protein
MLVFNKEFREAEERETRGRRPAGEEPAPVPMSESAFMESVAQTSLALTSALEQVESCLPALEDGRVKHQAIVLEKLVQTETVEEEIPTPDL